MSTAVLDSIGTTVSLRNVEREISVQLRAAQGDKDDVPVQRVRMSNLVIFTNCRDTATRRSRFLNARMNASCARSSASVASFTDAPAIAAISRK